MQFYQSCLGGELFLQTVGDSPLSSKLLKKMKDCILHSLIANCTIILMVSDMVGKNALRNRNNIFISLECNSEEEINICYQKLSVSGIQNHKIKTTFWGTLFGDLTDKYGKIIGY